MAGQRDKVVVAMKTSIVSPPEKVGLDSDRLRAAMRLLGDAAESGFLPGWSAAIYRHGIPVCIAHAGIRNPEDPSSPVKRDTIFLVASLTKPIVCAAALLLLADGAFALDQPVSTVIPEFSGNSKETICFIHLFTHTSGLHDQLPESRHLRATHAPIGDFVQAACRSDLLFQPGTKVSYQSMGILLLGEAVERLSGDCMRDLLKERLFESLSMTDTTLGLPIDGMTKAAYSLDAPFTPDENDVGTDWNTKYWRDFGAPWGGLHATVEDLSVFLAHMLGAVEGPLPPALRTAMVTDQIARLSGIPDSDKLTNRWGLGWMLANPHFGSLVSDSTFGHIGATGAVFWADPISGISCVLLTNQPRLLRDTPPEYFNLAARFSNAVAAAVM